MALACMLWRSSVRPTGPVSAALRTLMKNMPLWSTEPVWHGQSGPVAPSWHHPQAKKQTLQVSGKISALIWPRFASDWGVRVVHAYRQNHQKPRVHKILLWSFGTFASITFYDSEDSDSACLEATLRIFLSFCMLWLNWRFFLKNYISSTYKLYAALMFGVGEASMVSHPPETSQPLQRRLWVTLFGGFQKISQSLKQFGGKNSINSTEVAGSFPWRALKSFASPPPTKTLHKRHDAEGQKFKLF